MYFEWIVITCRVIVKPMSHSSCSKRFAAALKFTDSIHIHACWVSLCFRHKIQYDKVDEHSFKKQVQSLRMDTQFQIHAQWFNSSVDWLDLSCNMGRDVPQYDPTNSIEWWSNCEPCKLDIKNYFSRNKGVIYRSLKSTQIRIHVSIMISI